MKHHPWFATPKIRAVVPFPARLLWLLALLLPGAAHALTVIDANNLGRVDLPAGVEVAATSLNSTFADIDSATFRPIASDEHTVSATDMALWLRFRLDNRDNPRDTQWVLHPLSTRLDRMTVHVRDGAGAWTRTELSTRDPAASRPLPFRKLAFVHGTPAGSHTDVYVRLSQQAGNSIDADLVLWERSHFDRRLARENLLLGAYYGVMTTLILMTLLFTLALRDTGFLYHGLFLTSGALMWAIINGLMQQYLWPHSPWLHHNALSLALLLFALTALAFAKSFLRTREFMPVIHRLFSLAQWLIAAGMAARLLGVDADLVNLGVMMLAFLTLLPAATWQAWRCGVDQVLWFAVGWIIYGGGFALILLASGTPWVPPALAGPLAQMAGLIQALLLTLAMAERLLHLDRDRLRAIELAHQDPLTGLGNRRLLIQEHETMRLRYHRDGVPVYLILLDVDHFKTINDRFGHVAGDRGICELASLLRRVSRGGDVAVRLGGEEFALLLCADSDSVAWHIAERIRTLFASKPSHYGSDQVIPHTLSAGVARVMAPGSELGYRDMVALADEALYRAKAAGRNRTLFANPAGPLPEDNAAAT